MCSGTTGGGLKNVPEGTSGTCGPTWSGFLQMAIPGGEGDPGGGTRHRSVGSEWLRHVDEVSDGDCGIRAQVYLKGGLHVFDRSQ